MSERVIGEPFPQSSSDRLSIAPTLLVLVFSKTTFSGRGYVLSCSNHSHFSMNEFLQSFPIDNGGEQRWDEVGKSMEELLA